VRLTSLWKVSYPTPHLAAQLRGTSTVQSLLHGPRGTTPLGLESATATSERKSTDDMTVRIGHTGHAGSVHPFFLQPSLRHSPEDLFPHMWTVHTHILKMDSFARIRFVQLSLLQPTQLSRPPTSRSGAEAADGFGPPNFPKLASTD
jgi:hypothetical protein